MKKAICLLLAVFLSLSLPACAATDLAATDPTAAPTEDPTVLTGKVRSKIEAALGQSVDFDSDNYRYYGTYNGYIVLYKKLSYGDNALSVGGYRFADTDGGCILYAVFDREYTRLQYIHESGGITDAQLAQIYGIHKSYYADYTALCQEAAADSPEVPLTYEIEQAIDAALYAVEGYHIRVIEEPYRYYGQYNGYYVLFESTQACADMPVAVGKYVFHHFMSHVIWVIGEGAKLDLPDAYRKGLITDADLDDIYRIHVRHYSDAERENWFDWTDTAADIPGIWEFAYYVYTESHNHREILTQLDPKIPNMKPYQTLCFEADGTGTLTTFDGTQTAITWQLQAENETQLLINISGFSGVLYEIDWESADYHAITFDIADGTYAVLKKLSDGLLVPLP